MRENRDIAGRAGAAKAAWRRHALAAALLLAAVPAFAAVRSSGTIEITDDLAAGFAGSVDLAGGNLVLSGTLGQVAVSSAGAGGREVESGYFSRFVSTPSAFGASAVYQSSSTLTAGAAVYPNPSGTLYEIETSSASDFSGSLVYTSTAGWPAPVAALAGNTTYYTRLRASYMGEDHSPYTPTAVFTTLPSTPTPQGYAGVFSSSLTVAWSATSNSPETQYFAQVGPDPSFTSGLFTTTTGSTHTFSGLSPNTTYFVRLKAIGYLGDETAYVQFGSTITTAVVPSTTVPSAVSSVTATGYWAANGNPAGTRYLAQISTDNFTSVLASSQTLNAYAAFAGLQPNTTHYLRAASLNASGALSLYAALPEALTAAAPPLKQADTFTYRDGFAVTAQWLANGNHSATEYLAEVSTAADFSLLTSTAGWATGVSAALTGLEPERLYYFRVKARSASGAESAYESLGSTSTLTGVDTSSPTFTNNQAGDANWRSSNTAVYNVDLADYGGSGLDKLQVKASTGPLETGTLVFNWSDALTNINANAYTANWGLTSAQWGLLPSGTSYISVRAYDGYGNYKDLADAFYILKDTVTPTVTDAQAGETVWRKTDPGAIYAVSFADAEGGAGLAAVEYSASNAAGTANQNVLAWTALGGLTPGATFYNGPWALNFAGLASGATNYISVRARDLAGNIASVTDAFLVLKNVSGPEVRFTAPNAGFHSALAAISGTAAPVLEYAITGTELSIQDKGSNQYWDGAGFVSVSQVWLTASGQNSWTYNTSGIGWVSGTQYQAVARSSDTALNYSLPYATATFTFDTSVPALGVSTPASGGTYETPVLIAGTSLDAGPNSGVPYVYITLRRAVDQKWWNFFTGAWGDAAISTMTAGGATWALSADHALRGNLLNGGTYYAYASARDGAVPPNETPAGLYASTFTARDTVAPGDIAVSSAAQGSLPGRLLASWTASGDDGAAGALAQGWFAVNYATFAAYSFSTATAQVLISTANVLPGAQQQHLISGLLAGVTYYLKVFAGDEAGLWSGPSPMASGRAGISLSDSVSGNVWTPGGQGVTGVMVEAINRDLAVVKTVYTVDDGSGSFTMSGLDEGMYRIEATWIEDGFASSVASDQIPTGYAEVRFELSVSYQLASVGGELSAYRLSAAGFRAQAGGGAQVYVELYQRNRLVAVAPVGAGGRFLISNLLPGAYTLKVPDGAGGSKTLNVTLAPGQDLRISPLGELLKSAKVYAFPNPARRTVTFHIESELSPVTKHLSVFDVTGRVIKEFSDADFTLTGGAYEAAWNIPSGVASGVYIYSARVKFEATGETKSVVKKFAVVR